MNIGDWQINIIKEVSFPTLPDDAKSPIQKLVRYDFVHVPTRFRIERTIHYITPVDDNKRLEILTDFVAALKANFVDVFINQN